MREFILVIGYKSEMVRDYFKNGRKWNVNIEYVNQGKAMGTGHAISMVEEFVDDFIVLCGDTIFGSNDIKRILEIKPGIGLIKVKQPEEYGVAETQGDKLIKIYEKMKHPITNTINAGIYHFNNNIFDFIRKTEKSPRGEYEITDSINLMLKKEEMKTYELKEWRDIVYPWHLLDANSEILSKIDGKVGSSVEQNTTIKGKVIIGENSSIMNGAYIEGPVIIGNNCKIGPNCYIRPNTSIGNNCHVGNASEIKNSIIMDNSNVPHHNYVGDSVIGENCNLGSGTKIANLRLDKKDIRLILNGEKIDTKRRKLGAIIGDNVQTGINSMINTGAIIGNNVVIAPGSIIKDEIMPKSKIV